jgi:cholesterol transport system auxiliary component
MSRATSRTLLALLVTAAVLGAGCANVLERKPPEKQRFVLAPGRPDPVSGPRAGVLRVGVVRVSPPFQNRGFVRRTGEKTFANDFYNEFAAPPGTLLRDLLVEWLRDGTHFATVVRGSEAPPDWLLEVDLESLYQDLRDPAAPQATVAFAARLLVANAASASIALDKRYATTETAADASPAAIVAAWNRALAGLLAELAADLDTARGSARARTR